MYIYKPHAPKDAVLKDSALQNRLRPHASGKAAVAEPHILQPDVLKIRTAHAASLEPVHFHSYPLQRHTEQIAINLLAS